MHGDTCCNRNGDQREGGVQVGHVCNLGYGKKKKFVLYMYHMYMYVCIGVHVHSTHVPHLQSTGTESLG